MTDTGLVIVLGIVWITWFTLSIWETISMLALVAAIQGGSDEEMQKQGRAYWGIRAFGGQWRLFFGASVFGAIIPFFVHDAVAMFPTFLVMTLISVGAASGSYTVIALVYSQKPALNTTGLAARMGLSAFFGTGLAIGSYLLILWCTGSLTSFASPLTMVGVAWGLAGAVVPLFKAIREATKEVEYPLFVRPFTFDELTKNT